MNKILEFIKEYVNSYTYQDENKYIINLNIDINELFERSIKNFKINYFGTYHNAIYKFLINNDILIRKILEMYYYENNDNSIEIKKDNDFYIEYKNCKVITKDQIKEYSAGYVVLKNDDNNLYEVINYYKNYVCVELAYTNIIETKNLRPFLKINDNIIKSNNNYYKLINLEYSIKLSHLSYKNYDIVFYKNQKFMVKK
ncbi:MAG: hypothetical protein KatS3mg068_2662 [Candidatus Sericytochromatia bacterium]|nr:MAG: hypothetical protein KatS3mg068_2662 [Candidatus Sericytochromatia bacterium]